MMIRAAALTRTTGRASATIPSSSPIISKPLSRGSLARTVFLKSGNTTHYFDNPQFWSTAGIPNDQSDPNYPNVEDVTSRQELPTPENDGTYHNFPYEVTVKHTPLPDEFEMYNVTDDPMELNNLYSATNPLPEQAVLAQLLEQQCAQKRLTPCSGDVPGQPMCAQPACKT